MENIYDLSKSPWLTQDPIRLREYFDTYHQLLDNVHGRQHQENVESDAKLLKFLNIEVNNEAKKQEAIRTLHGACSIDLLNVEDELTPQDTGAMLPIRQSGRLTNWYTGAFQDGVIPAGAVEALNTIKAQKDELNLRETENEYAKNRFRRLRYFSAVRMVINENNTPMPTVEAESKERLRDIILNVRIQRPYHKKTHTKKACNRFPKHSQELLVLGSQKLSELRDAIICINDLAVNKDFSSDPRLQNLSDLPNTAEEFPSGFFYINGSFYDDMRKPGSVTYAQNIITWSQKYPEIGELKIKKMEETTFLDLELRLGYPYVYLHQGNCEHLIVFTDVRIHHPNDIQDPRRYPLLRGQANKISVKCVICQLHLANWIVKDEPRIKVPNAHLCDRCLHTFCYDNKGIKNHDIRVYPFFDEYVAQQKKRKE